MKGILVEILNELAGRIRVQEFGCGCFQSSRAQTSTEAGSGAKSVWWEILCSIDYSRMRSRRCKAGGGVVCKDEVCCGRNGPLDAERSTAAAAGVRQSRLNQNVDYKTKQAQSRWNKH
jgi:hypothetical protein